MKKFKHIFLVIGFAFFAYLIHRVGLSGITRALNLVGWNFLIIFGLYFVFYTLQNFAWAVEMRETFRDVGFASLYKARIAGEAMNCLIPLGNFGGEPVKAYLLDGRAKRTEIAASLVLDKTVFAFASLLYILAGLLIAVFVLKTFSFKLKLVIFLLLVLMMWGLVVFIRKGDFFSAFFSKVRRLGIASNFLAKKMDAIRNMDERIASFYRANRRRFLASVLLHFSARMMQALEFYLVFVYLGFDLSFEHAICVNSLTVIINAMFFFVPGHWGVTEGAQGFIFMGLGMSLTAGITLGVVRRVRHIFWTLIGLAIFSLSGPRKKHEVIENIVGGNEY